MKVFVTGVAGQLGHDLVNELHKNNIEAIGSDLAPNYNGIEDDSYVTKAPYYPMDICDKEAVSSTLEKVRPDAVIHCAAWTAVDAAEDEENKEKVKMINVTGTENIALACKNIDAKMLYLSTDYVFDGKGEKPWEPDQKDFAPLNVYGRSKLDGELAIERILKKFFIVRISWVFGKNGNNFIKTMLKVGANHDKLTVVNDQIGTPTYTYDLAILLTDMIQSQAYGFYHASNEGGYISWYDFAVEIFNQAKSINGKSHPEYDADHLTVSPVTTEEYGISKAARPFNSRLNKEKLKENGFKPLPDWKDALKRYLEEII